MAKFTHQEKQRQAESDQGEAQKLNVQTPAVLTVKEAAKALRVSRWTVYQLIRSGRLITFKIGRSRRVLAAAVHDLIAQLSAEEAS
jgi:excisionase family DNA binding protein